jgi:uncharacterized MAPEG superfamily protein
MTIELEILAWSIVLGLLQVALAAVLMTRQRGVKWNAGNRDGDVQPLSGIAARAARASHNFLETFVFFACAALAVVLTHRNSRHTALGSEIYFFARLAYLPIYLVGIPYLRSAVWTVSVVGLVTVVSALL